MRLAGAVGGIFILLALPPLLVAAAAPQLTIVSPTNGATIDETSVTVEFDITEFEVVPSSVPLADAGKRPEANRPGQGHLHLMLDLQPLVIWESTNPYTFENVPPGQHQLMVEAVNNDHSPLSPRVVQTIGFSTLSGQVMPATGAETSRRPNIGPEAAALMGVVALGFGVLMRLRGGSVGRSVRRERSRRDD